MKNEINNNNVNNGKEMIEMTNAKIMNINEVRTIVAKNAANTVATIVTAAITFTNEGVKSLTAELNAIGIPSDSLDFYYIVDSKENLQKLADEFGDDIFVFDEDDCAEMFKVGTANKIEISAAEEVPATEEVPAEENTTSESVDEDDIPEVIVDDTPEATPATEEPVVEEVPEIDTSKLEEADEQHDEIAGFKYVIEQMKAEMAAKDAEINKLRGENESLRADNAAQAQRIEKAKTEYIKLRNEKDELVKANISYEKEIGKLTAENQNLINENQALKSAAANNGSKVDAKVIQAEVEALKNDFDAKVDAIEKAAQEQLDQATAAAEEIVGEAQVEIDKLTAENGQLKAQVAQLQKVEATVSAKEFNELKVAFATAEEKLNNLAKKFASDVSEF